MMKMSGRPGKATNMNHRPEGPQGVNMKLKTFSVLVLTSLLLVPAISAAKNPDDLHITELEEKVLQLDEAASGLQDEYRYLQKEMEDDEALAGDYTKAIENLNSFLGSDEHYYDMSEAIPDIILSNGRKLRTLNEVETYVKQAKKDLPRVKQSIEEHKELLSEVRKGYESLTSEQRIYRTAFTKRRSRLAIIGLWKFQGESAVVRLMPFSDYKECSAWSKTPAYIAVAQGEGLDEFKNGELVFFLHEADIMDPYYYTGSEYEWGFSKTKRNGSPEMTTIRVRLDTNTKKMHYKSKDQHLILTKIK